MWHGYLSLLTLKILEPNTCRNTLRTIKWEYKKVQGVYK